MGNTEQREKERLTGDTEQRRGGDRQEGEISEDANSPKGGCDPREEETTRGRDVKSPREG